MTILRLVFLPPLAFVAELTVKGALFGGLAGFKKAVNRWAFVFTTEAKRYERYFKDDNNLKKKT